MLATAAKTLTAVVDSCHLGVVYGAIDDKRVAVGLTQYLNGNRRMTEALDARIVIEGYRRIGDWTKLGPTHYTATVEVHPQRCETCVNGCDCETGTPGCGHAYCWGLVSNELRNSCPGVATVKL